MVLVGILVVACGCARVGSADPTTEASTTATPPEQPPAHPGVVFTDNPSIVNPRPIPVDSWSRVGDDAVQLHFTIGSPACSGVHSTVSETAETVAVELRSGTLPQAVGRMCPMIAVFGTLDVPLQSPLGDRHVVTVF